jgi:NDP-sugar pyrophosphorylase family protein
MRVIVLKAMILAAGYGTRLRPLTDRVPKCLVCVAGKPVLEHTIEWLVSFGVADIIINVSHLADVVMDGVGDGRRWGVRISYSIEDRPLGTAGGVKKASWFFDGPFLVWYGDNLSRCNLERLYGLHREKGGLATIGLHYRDDVSQSGIVAVDADDRVMQFLEKPGSSQVFSHWVNAGIYVLEPGVLNFIGPEEAPDFGRHVFPNMLSNGQALFGYRLSADEGLAWIDRPEDIERITSHI